MAPKELDDSLRGRRLKALPQRGSEIFTTTRLQNNYLLGIPSPWLAAEEVRALSGAGFDKAQVTVDPAPLAPYDVNRDVLRALNFDPAADVDAVVAAAAGRLVGAAGAPALVKAWKLCDEAVRGFPSIMLYGDNNWGFPWYRLLVRPFAPDIGRIPEAERAYYEKYMTVTFNNPNLVDLGTDILWTLMTAEQADAAVAQADRATWKPLDGAIAALRAAAGGAEAGAKAASRTSSTASGPCAATSGPCATRRPGWPASTVTSKPRTRPKRPGAAMRSGPWSTTRSGTQETWPRSSSPRRRGSCRSTRAEKPSTCTARTCPSSSGRRSP